MQQWTDAKAWQTQEINNTNDPQKKCLGRVSKNNLLEGLNQFYGAFIVLNSDVDQDTFGKVTKHNTHDSQEVSSFPAGDHKAARNNHDSTTHQREP